MPRSVETSLAGRALAAVREASWADGGRVLAAALGLLAAHAWLRFTSLTGADFAAADFMSFYAAGALAHGPSPADAYDMAAHLAAERSFQSGGTPPHTVFLYPPVALLVFAPLALLPYGAAFAAWVAAQAALFVSALRATGAGWRSVACCAAFPALLQCGVMGQNAMLTAALFAGGTALLARGRPVLAGAVLGCLCYKPHLAVLLPVAMIAAREWRATFATACMAVFLCAGAAAAFGPDVWAGYLGSFAANASANYSALVPYQLYTSVLGAVRSMGGEAAWAGGAQAVSAMAAAASVWLIWRRTTRNSAARPVSLIAGTMLAVPVVMFYDLLAVTVCLCWLAADARRTGWLPWEKAVAAFCFMASFAAGMAGGLECLPVGPAVYTLLMVSAWRRAVRSPRRIRGAGGAPQDAMGSAAAA